MPAKIKAEEAEVADPGYGTSRHRAPLLWLVIPFLVGATLRRLGGEWPFAPAAAFGAAAATLGAAASFGRGRFAHRLWAACIVGAGTLIGLLYPLARPSPLAAHANGPIRVTVRVSRIGPPHASPHGQAWTASGFGSLVENGEPIYFALRVDPSAALPIRGQEIELRGKLKAVPARGGPDTFNGYLRGSGIGFELSPAYEVAAESRADPQRSGRQVGSLGSVSAYAQWREELAKRMTQLLAVGFEARPDLAAIYRAMMLGRKEGLAPSQKELFVSTGTMHLFAINGLHIGIVALSLHALLALFRVPGRWGAPFVLGALWIDVDSTGAAPSAVRAFLMVGAIEIAAAVGLPMNPLAAITAAAAVMLAIAPGAEFGASFQMSFGVVAALILLGAPGARRLSGRWDPYPFLPHAGRTRFQRARAAAQSHAAAALGFSAAAALVSAITGATYFAVWAPVGVPANLLLMPLATLVIIAGFAAIVAGLAHAAGLTVLFNAAARLLLRAMVAGLRRFNACPEGHFPAHLRAGWIGPAALALLLGACLWGYSRDWREDRGGWWPPFLITAVTMIFGVKYG